MAESSVMEPVLGIEYRVNSTINRVIRRIGGVRSLCNAICAAFQWFPIKGSRGRHFKPPIEVVVGIAVPPLIPWVDWYLVSVNRAGFHSLSLVKRRSPRTLRDHGLQDNPGYEAG